MTRADESIYLGMFLEVDDASLRIQSTIVTSFMKINRLIESHSLKSCAHYCSQSPLFHGMAIFPECPINPGDCIAAGGRVFQFLLR